MSEQTITLTRHGAVGVVTIDDPASHNRLDEPLRSQLADACAATADDDAVRVLLIEGSSAAYATGLSLTPMSSPGPASVVASLRKPALAWIAGECLDNGLELALACDVRMASQLATFGMRHVRNGRLPSDGGTQRLARLIGRGQALRLMLTCDVIDANEAVRIGLVECLGSRDDALSLATRIADAAPIASAYAKEAVAGALDLTLAQGLSLEHDLSVLLQSTSDRAEGLAAFAERRQPRFEGR